MLTAYLYNVSKCISCL